MTPPDESVDALLERLRGEELEAVVEAIEVAGEVLQFRALVMMRQNGRVDWDGDRVSRGMLRAVAVLERKRLEFGGEARGGG